MIINIVKYFMVFLLMCLAFAVYSIALDKVFYAIDGIKNDAATTQGYKAYFPLFIGYYGLFVVLGMTIFELIVFFLGITNWKIQLAFAMIVGVIIGLSVGTSNFSFYTGELAGFKSVAVYTMLGATFILLKIIYQIKHQSFWAKVNQRD